MTAIRSGIPTTYGGTRFRSRLEARWAVFFDLIGWPWTYEPFDAPGWIPDFLIAGDAPFLVEVGPCVSPEDYLEKAAKPLTFLERPTLVLGVSPFLRPSDWNIPIGVLTNDGNGEGLAEAAFGSCPSCRAVCVTHVDGIFTHRPCGHYTGGDHGLGFEVGWVDALWRRAGNAVQWAGSRPSPIGEILRTLR